MGASSKRLNSPTAALFTHTSIRPKCSTARQFPDGAFVGHVGRHAQRPCSFGLALGGRSSRGCSRRAARTTPEPSRAKARAAARPMPLDAPVMTTTESLNFLDMRCLLILCARQPESFHYLGLLAVAVSRVPAVTRSKT